MWINQKRDRSTLHLLSTVGFRKHAGVVVATWVALYRVDERTTRRGWAHRERAKKTPGLLHHTPVKSCRDEEEKNVAKLHVRCGLDVDVSPRIFVLCFDAAWHAKTFRFFELIVAHNYVHAM